MAAELFAAVSPAAFLEISIPGGLRMVREIRECELHELLELYLHLHDKEVPEMSEQLLAAWKMILQDPNHHVIVWEEDGKLISSCVCVIIPNLARNVRPYALVENVVTHADYRGRGCASACLDRAREIAEKAGCYKMMLLTGSKSEETLRFYRKAGYNSEDKMGFVQWLE